jgi:hypothetical protein
MYCDTVHQLENDMGWARGMCVGEKRNKQKVMVWTLREREHMEDIVVDGRISIMQ